MTHLQRFNRWVSWITITFLSGTIVLPYYAHGAGGASKSTAPAAQEVKPLEPESGSEPWKGPSSESKYHFSLLTGVGVIGVSPGFGLMGAASKKVVHRGFVKEINDQVHLELHFGPQIYMGKFSFLYSVHLRWDFDLDSEWRFYALAGLGGHIAHVNLGGTWGLYPRVALGAFYKMTQAVWLRGELSHEAMLVGVTIPI
ncbi:MAG: hypothetical protein AAB425_03110 [Bdellovibrionota bacterium]